MRALLSKAWKVREGLMVKLGRENFQKEPSEDHDAIRMREEVVY